MSTITEDGRTRLTFDEAVALLPDGDKVHTFLDGGFAAIGADWSREQILVLLQHGAPELSGPSATKLGHGLVAFRPDGPVFIATASKGGDAPEAQH